jgi:cyclin-dependent kinase regulatory subunit CKS1
MSSSKEIDYSDKYSDDKYEYRHVILPSHLKSKLPHPMRLMTEKEWRGLGVCQSLGWEHYEIYKPELHVLLFRRLKTYQAPKDDELKKLITSLK